MALQSAVGISVGFSATLASTHDSTGMGALTFLPCGYLAAVPDLDGEYDVSAFDNLTTGDEEKLADMFRAGEGELTFGFDPSDAGQAAIEAAKGSKGVFAFTLSGGTIYYRNTVVKSYRPTGFEAGNVVRASVSLAFEKTTIKV